MNRSSLFFYFSCFFADRSLSRDREDILPIVKSTEKNLQQWRIVSKNLGDILLLNILKHGSLSKIAKKIGKERRKKETKKLVGHSNIQPQQIYFATWE
jgi:hypothetical protein